VGPSILRKPDVIFLKKILHLSEAKLNLLSLFPKAPTDERTALPFLPTYLEFTEGFGAKPKLHICAAKGLAIIRFELITSHDIHKRFKFGGKG